MLVHNARSFLEMLVSIYIDSFVHLQYITIQIFMDHSFHPNCWLGQTELRPEAVEGDLDGLYVSILHARQCRLRVLFIGRVF